MSLSAIITVMSTAADARTPPTGTVTFLFSDIEGSTRLLQQLGDRYADVLELHRETLRRAFAAHGGVERGTEGDSFFVAFGDAVEAVAAAGEGTQNLAQARWPEGVTVRVRIGLHTGEGRLVGGDYVGMDVHRAARIAAAGNGGQVLLSESTRILAERGLPSDASLLDLGEHQLKDLPFPEHLYQLIIDGQPTEFPPLRSVTRTVANLPAQLPSIVGRDVEIETVRDLLRGSRLVTVTGPGGTGKTRLVQEVAREIARNVQTDVVFVPLEALTDADLITIEIIRALRLDVAAARDPVQRLVEHLGARPTLIILDNLEQLAGAGRPVRSLLDRVPTLSVLVASQAALHIAGEQEFPLRPLAFRSADGAEADAPQQLAQNPAVALFVERARSIRPDFVLDASNADAVLEICARLDGLPLAIELAAAQVRLLSPASILERIEGTLDALSSRRDDLPARQRTLRATVAWSYELLPDAERRLFRRLAVFAGGGRLSEIEGIASAEPVIVAPLAVLETLVDRSLVTPQNGPGTDDRFGLPETMRTYARELLEETGEAAAVIARHAALYRDLARRAESELYGRSRRSWLNRLTEDINNIRAALDSLAAQGELENAMEMAADLWRFWQQRGHLIEARDRVDGLLAASSGPGASVRPFVLSRAEEAAGSIRYWMTSDRAVPRPFYERSLEHAIESGDRLRQAWAMYNLAFCFDFTPEVGLAEAGRAAELRQGALEIFREVGDRRGVAEALWSSSGSARVMLMDRATARRQLEQVLPLQEEIGDVYAIAWTRNSLGLLAAMDGRLDEADGLVMQVAEAFADDGDGAGEIVAVQEFAALAALRGDDLTAVRYAAAANAAARAIGTELPNIPPVTGPIAAATARVAPEDLDREREVGVAIGARSILSTVLASRRPASGARPSP